MRSPADPPVTAALCAGADAYPYPVNTYRGPGYAGHFEDATGMTYMKARYYGGIVGRFISPDPVGVDTTTGGNFNRYWYANNNPMKYVDPDGRQACSNRKCIEGRSTRNAPQQAGPTEQIRNADSQAVAASRNVSLSDGTKIDFSEREQPFSVNESGTRAGVDTEAMCMLCGGEKVWKMTFSIPEGDSAGHTHGEDREQKPGIEDAPSRVGDTRYVITANRVMAVDRTQVGPRVRVLDGPMPKGTERLMIERRIEGWKREAPAACVPSSGC